MSTAPIPPPSFVLEEQLATPLPPAHSVGQSVRALNAILNTLASPESIAAHHAGDCCATVDSNLWAPAWEGARNFRDHFLVTLARMTRDQWRLDVAKIVKTQPEFNRASMISKALDTRLRITLDFAFRFTTPRHVCMLSDVLMLAFESEMKPTDFSTELATSAARSPNRTEAMLEALVLGASGMHGYQPERVMASAKPRSKTAVESDAD